MASFLTRNSGGGRALSADLARSLRAGIAESRASTPIVGGTPLLRLLKSGVWVFGQTNDPVQIGSHWAVNPMSVKHGWVCWSDNPGNAKNELLGEVMHPVYEPKPLCPEPIRDFEWKEQRSFDTKCILGDDDGVQVLYKTSSIGGMRDFDNFLAELGEQLDEEHGTPDFPVAIVQFSSAPYQHTKYGQIFNPVITVIDWADMELTQRQSATSVGNGAPAAEAPAPAPAAAAAPRRSKPPLNAAPTGTGPVAPEVVAAAAAAAAATATGGRPGAAPRRQRPGTSV